MPCTPCCRTSSALRSASGIVVRRSTISSSLSFGITMSVQPEVGEKAAEENRDELTEIIQGNDMVFVTCGMGGASSFNSHIKTRKAL